MYLTLFISAFAAATILPAQSEALLAYQVSIAPDAVIKLVAVATLGNVLGATFNWWLGRLTENFRAKKWSQQRLLERRTALVGWIVRILAPYRSPGAPLR